MQSYGTNLIFLLFWHFLVKCVDIGASEETVLHGQKGVRAKGFQDVGLLCGGAGGFGRQIWGVVLLEAG